MPCWPTAQDVLTPRWSGTWGSPRRRWPRSWPGSSPTPAAWRRVGVPGRPPLDVAGRDVVACDDGLATGATMRAALLALLETDRRLAPSWSGCRSPRARASSCCGRRCGAGSTRWWRSHPAAVPRGVLGLRRLHPADRRGDPRDPVRARWPADRVACNPSPGARTRRLADTQAGWSHLSGRRPRRPDRQPEQAPGVRVPVLRDLRGDPLGVGLRPAGR